MRRNVLLLLSFATLAAPALAAQDAPSLAELGALLSLEDRRLFDGAALQRAGQHPDTTVRRRAAMSMGRIGDRAAVPLLLTLLNDRDSVTRIEAVFSLGELGDRAAVAELIALSTRFPPNAIGDAEIEVVSALAKLGGPEAERALGAILDRHPATMSTQTDLATAQVLLEAWRLGRTSTIAPRLKEYIRTAQGEWRRNAAYSATRLPRFGDAGAALLEAVQDQDGATRSYVARGLLAQVADSAGIPRESFLSRLRELVNDPEAQVRVGALRALASYEDSTLAPLAAGRLTDRDNNVPVQAAAALGSLKGSRAALTLAERLPGAASFGQRRAMLMALAAVDPTRAIEAGRTWRTDTDWRTRAAYAEMLAATGTPAARQQLAEMLTDPEPRVIGFVLNALAALAPAGDTALLTIARERLAHADVIVRAAAIDLVGRERDPSTIRELAAAYRRAESDPIDDARLGAVRALAGIMQRHPAARADVESALLSGVRSNDYQVRRLVAERFGEAAMRRTWGSVGPLETGRSAEEYQDIARRYIIGYARPGNITIDTERGSIVLTLYAYDAPLTVENFVRLLDRRYFDNGRWHRVVPNFVIQDGDPRGDGSGGPGTTIRDEMNRRRYGRGTVGMALSGPDTGGSQFFITHSPQPHLDGGYTVFGQVVSGWDVLDQIVQGDRIRRIFR